MDEAEHAREQELQQRVEKDVDQLKQALGVRADRERTAPSSD